MTEKHPRPTPTPPDRSNPSNESSVVISLHELVRLERARVEEEARDHAARQEEAMRQELGRQARARADELSRAAAAQERRRQAELRAQMDEAQIEAAKLSQIAQHAMQEQHRLHMERLAVEQAHAREMERLSSTRTKHRAFGPAIVIALGVAMVATLLSLVFVVAVLPARQAHEAAMRAKVMVESNDPAQLDRAEGELAVARAKDPQSAEVAALDEEIAKKRADLRQKHHAADDAKQKTLDDLRRNFELATHQTLPQPSTATSAPTTKLPTTKPAKPPKKTDDGGCTVEVAGVPMCAKK